jgi:hypothetical protein
MSAQSVSIAVMFGWVVDSFKLLRKNLRGLMSASFITLVLGLLMCVPMWLAMMSGMMDAMKTGGMPQPGMPMTGDMTLFYTVYAITIVASLLLFPPILVGWIRLCQNIDQNNAASGFDILKPYKDKQLWLRGIGFAFLGLLIYVAFMGVFALSFWGAISDFIQQAEAQQAAMLLGATPAPPNFSMSLVFGYFGFIGIALFLQFVYMIGFAEISLSPTSPIAAMKQAALGVFKNAFKLILFLICIAIVFYIALFIVSLILGLIVVVLSFIHPAIGAIAAIALFLPVFLCLYPLMFAGHYFMWKSVLGDSSPALPNSYDSSLSV